MSNRNELVAVVKGMGLTCKELEKSVVAIKVAEVTGKKSAWVIAGEYDKIIKGELFEEDFESKGEFAEVMGVSAGLISQYTKAVEFIRVMESTKDPMFTRDNTTVGKAYMLAGLEDLQDFLGYCESEGIDVLQLSDAGLKQTIKAYKNMVVVDDTEEVEDKDTEDDEVEDTDTEEVEDKIVYIKELLQELTAEELKEIKSFIRTLK